MLCTIVSVSHQRMGCNMTEQERTRLTNLLYALILAEPRRPMEEEKREDSQASTKTSNRQRNLQPDSRTARQRRRIRKTVNSQASREEHREPLESDSSAA